MWALLRAGTLGGFAALLVRCFLFCPLPLRSQHQPLPARSYKDAVVRVESLQAAERTFINPLCHTQLLTHGRETEGAVVLLHGYTNCPHQFHQLAPRIYQRGHNVLIPRFPYHGYRDVMSDGHGQLTAGQLAATTMDAVDIARGLGRHVTLVGFSMGGALAAWAAQFRADLDRAVLVSPAIGLRAIPASISAAYANLFALWPNFFGWFHPELKEDVPRSRHAYPRFSSRGVAALLRISQLTLAAARSAPPAASQIYVITNPSDETVDNWATDGLVDQWRKHAAAVHTHEFPARLNLIHDFIDPGQPKQQVDRVYPVLLDLILG